MERLKSIQVSAGDTHKGECHACGFITDITAYRGNYCGRRGKHLLMGLCSLCAHTRSGNALQYRSQYGESANVIHTMCYLANAILGTNGTRTLRASQDQLAASLESLHPEYVWNPDPSDD